MQRFHVCQKQFFLQFWLIKAPEVRVRWLPSLVKTTPTSASTDGVKEEGVAAAARPTAREEAKIWRERISVVLILSVEECLLGLWCEFLNLGSIQIVLIVPCQMLVSLS